MKNVFRLFGRFTMVMMIIGMVTLTSCEKEDVFDGKKPTDQVLGGGDEIGNPEDFYPYTDKVIIESHLEYIGSGYGTINILEVFRDKELFLENPDTIQTRKIIFNGKKITTDTITINNRIVYNPIGNPDKEEIEGDVYIVFFKDNKRISRKYELNRSRGTIPMNKHNGVTISDLEVDKILNTL